jgi:4-hydroxy-tetrahydrodipicolinate reductase
LSRVRQPDQTVPVVQTIGRREARGAALSGFFVISAEVIFGMPDQRLSIRHDSGSSARPYVDGALLAIRRVSTLVGVHRGLDTVLDL